MTRVLTSDEKDQMALRVIRRRPGWWAVLSYEKHLVKIASIMRPRTIEEILADDENLLTELDTMLK